MSDLADGMHPVATSIGFEISSDFYDDWSLTEKFRKSWIEGRFVSPFPAEVGDAQALAASIGGAGATLWYPGGAMIADPAALNGNGLAMRVHMFDTEYNDLGSFANDLKLTKWFNDLALTLGYYKASQTIDMALDDVSAKTALCTHRAFQIDHRAIFKFGKGRLLDGFGADIELGHGAVQVTDRQADPVDSDAVA